MECSVLDWTTLAPSTGNVVSYVDNKKFVITFYIHISVHSSVFLELHILTYLCIFYLSTRNIWQVKMTD